MHSQSLQSQLVTDLELCKCTLETRILRVSAQYNNTTPLTDAAAAAAANDDDEEEEVHALRSDDANAIEKRTQDPRACVHATNVCLGFLLGECARAVSASWDDPRESGRRIDQRRGRDDAQCCLCHPVAHAAVLGEVVAPETAASVRPACPSRAVYPY